MFVVLAGLVSASTPTCALPADSFATTCAGTSINELTTCAFRCKKYYVPTALTYTCPMGGGTPSPAGIYCVPDQKFARRFPWRSSRCMYPNRVYSGASAVVGMASQREDQLTIDDGNDGEITYSGFRTFGRYSVFEFMFQYRIVSKSGTGGEGVWATISTNAAPDQTNAAGTAVSTGGLIAIELDFVADSYDTAAATALGEPDYAGQHVALLYNDLDHGVAAQASLAPMVSSETFAVAGTFTDVSVVFKNIQQSASTLVELWQGGELVARDIITKTMTANSQIDTIVSQPKLLYASIYSDQSMSDKAEIRIKNVQVCGAEAPQLWHRFQVVSRVRQCVQVISFGNPDISRPGVWRTGVCPAGVTLVPIAPQANPVTA